MRVLGISAFHRDAAAALVVDGIPVAAAQEERFTKKRLDPAFPARAIRYCLREADITGPELDEVVFYEKPLRKFERLLVTQLRAFPRATKPFAHTMFLWLGDRLWLKHRIAEEVGVPIGRVRFMEHQRSHAASAFFLSPFEQAAVLTVDDAGEWATTTLAEGQGRELTIHAETHFPHSLGLLVSAITQFLGFEPGHDEAKLEALARLGAPRFEAAFEQLVAPADAGSFAIDTTCFRFPFDAERLWDQSLEERLGPPRFPGAKLRIEAPDARDADVAASLQVVLEQRVLALCDELQRRVPSENLCFAGALATNRALNARILADGPFRRLYVPPDPGEAGAALGAALALSAARGTERAPEGGTALGEALDPAFAEEGARQLGSVDAAETELAERLAAGACMGWVRGRMPFGAHSLGTRSILADARDPAGRGRLFAAIQESEDFLPCGIALPADRAAEYVDAPEGAADVLRLAHLVVPAKDALQRAAPSAVLPDGTAWVQVVDAERDPRFHRLLTRVGERTGAPLLLHASFRLHGATLVRSEADAVDAFHRSRLDGLVVEDRTYDRA